MPKIKYEVWQLSMKLEPKIFYWNKHNRVNLKLYQKVVYKYNTKQNLMIFIPFKDSSLVITLLHNYLILLLVSPQPLPLVGNIFS